MPWSPSFVLGLPPRVGFWKKSTWPCQNIIHLMPCQNPRRLYVHLVFTYSIYWSLKLSVKRTWTGSAFSTNESAWSLMVSWALSRVCEMALRHHMSASLAVIVWKVVGWHLFLTNDPQQFHNWNRMEVMVWLGHECRSRVWLRQRQLKLQY